jgi:hypothetical protein
MGWRRWCADLAQIRGSTRSELTASLSVLAEIVNRGGMLAFVEPDPGSGTVPMQFVLQPDGDVVVRIDVAHIGDPTLPAQIRQVVTKLVAHLAWAQRSFDAMRRLLQTTITVMLCGSAAGGVSAASDWVEQFLIGVAFLSIGVVLRFFRGAVIRWIFLRVAG